VPPAAIGDHCPIAQDKDDPNRLFARNASGGDIKKLLYGIRLIATEFMH
jgi:hypothetical protein